MSIDALERAARQAVEALILAKAELRAVAENEGHIYGNDPDVEVKAYDAIVALRRALETP